MFETILAPKFSFWEMRTEFWKSCGWPEAEAQLGSSALEISGGGLGAGQVAMGGG